jgi:O-antigen/teichoic acid export membrane protein
VLFRSIGGSGFSQLIILFTAPILTRLYTPESIGTYEIFNSIVAIILSIATLQYDVAIYTSINRLQALRAFSTTLIVVTLVSFSAFFIINLAKTRIVSSFGLNDSRYLELMVPIYIFFASCYNVLITWFTKFGKFKMIATVRVILSICIGITQVSFGLLNWGYWGLVISSLVVQFITFLILIVPFYKQNFRFFKYLNLKDIVNVFKSNYQLPLLVLPGDFLNNITQNLPTFFLGKISPSLLGYYSLSKRILGLPLSFISASFRNIYIQEASKEFNQTGMSIVTVTKHLKLFCIIGLILIIGVSVLSSTLVPILFGENWKPAVPFIIVLSFSYVFRFISGTLSFIMILGNKSRFIDLFWQIAMLITIYLAFFISNFFSFSQMLTIVSYSTLTCIFYFAYVFQIIKVSKGLKTD